MKQEPRGEKRRGRGGGGGGHTDRWDSASGTV